jgi:hypothetical protein
MIRAGGKICVFSATRRRNTKTLKTLAAAPPSPQPPPRRGLLFAHTTTTTPGPASGRPFVNAIMAGARKLQAEIDREAGGGARRARKLFLRCRFFASQRRNAAGGAGARHGHAARGGSSLFWARA